MTQDLARRLRAAGCVFAEEEAAVLLQAAPDDIQLEAMVARRVAGEPLEHILGWAEFAGIRVEVRADVFVPRRRTEALVAHALRRLPPEARLHEPRSSLDGGPDGLDLARRVVAGAAEWLAPGGTVHIEVTSDQAPELAEFARDHGLVVAADEFSATRPAT